MTREQHIDTRRISFPKQGQVELETVPRTFTLGPDDVLIETTYSVVSAGTEVAKLTGAQKVSYPFVPGNRAVGRVVAVGDAQTDLSPGTRIFSHTPHASHALASRLMMPIPDGVHDRDGALLGLALVAMTSLRVGEVELGDRAVVIGLGLVGNLAAQLLQLAGADVIGVDLNAGRLDRARACGLHQLIDAGTDDVETAVMDATGGRGVDVVVEASGTAVAAELAVSLTGKRGEGVVVLLGSPRKGYETDLTSFLNHIHLWRNGSVTVRGAHEWRYPLQHTPFQKHSMQRNAEIIFRLIAQDRLQTGPLITHTYRPEQALEAFQGLRDDPGDYMGVVFDWTSER